jgi:hypothetical protein
MEIEFIDFNCHICKLPARAECEQCRSIYYCSHGCQLVDWGIHQHICNIELTSMNQLPPVEGIFSKSQKPIVADKESIKPIFAQMVALLKSAGVDAKKKPAIKGNDPTKHNYDARLKKIVAVGLRRGLHATLQLTHVASDATIETLMAGMPVNIIVDILFAGLDAALFVAQVVPDVITVLTGFGDVGGMKILSSFSEGGPQAVRAEVDRVLSSLRQRADQGAADLVDKFLSGLQNMYSTAIEWIAPFFASLVQCGIPEGFGAAKLVVENFLVAATLFVKDKPFALLEKLFMILPEAARDFLMSKEAIIRLLGKIYSFLLTLFPPPGSSKSVRIKAALKRTGTAELIVAPMVLMIGPGTAVVAIAATAAAAGGGMSTETASVFMAKQIKDHLVPHIEKIADAAQSCMSLVFALSYCIELKAMQKTPVAAEEKKLEVAPEEKKPETALAKIEEKK